jgi:5'-nucleotidase
MRILVTNDDGIHAEGLAVAEAIARELAGEDGEVWVVAPHDEQSGASRSLSLSQPIRLQRVAERRFAVRGTPADCVIMALCHLLPATPDLVISGVNRGQNIADDITYSGTIAAAMEGAVLDVPSFALSQCYGIEREEVPWEVARAHGAAVIRRVLAAGEKAGRLFNVNFPDCRPAEVRGISVCRQGKRDINELIVDAREDLRGRPYYWLGFRRRADNPPPGTDLHAIQNRMIALTPLHLNLTRQEALRVLGEAVGKA